jgi:crossover junction endodeoxyribonuclease RuvC
MIVLGIDPSLNSTGYGILEARNSKLHYITSGIITHAKETDFPQKLVNISNVLNDIILQYQPVKSGIEETFVNVNFKTSLKLGMVRGAIILTIAKCGIPIFEISPNSAKKSITGFGKAGKAQVSFMASRILSGIPEGKIFKTDDETDALSIAITTYFMK